MDKSFRMPPLGTAGNGGSLFVLTRRTGLSYIVGAVLARTTFPPGWGRSWDALAAWNSQNRFSVDSETALSYDTAHPNMIADRQPVVSFKLSGKSRCSVRSDSDGLGVSFSSDSFSADIPCSQLGTRLVRRIETAKRHNCGTFRVYFDMPCHEFGICEAEKAYRKTIADRRRSR